MIPLRELVVGLSYLGCRFHVMSVFADDLHMVAADLQRGECPDGVRKLDGDGESFSYAQGQSSYLLSISKGGIARLCRHKGILSSEGVDTSAGAAISKSAISSAASKKGSGWPTGLILGLLAGRYMSNGIPDLDLVMPLRFSLDSRSWEAYSGGLVTWMKSEL